MNNPGNYAPNYYPPPPVYPYQSYPPQQPKIGWGERFIVLGISLFFYVIALCTPVLRFDDGKDSTWYGIAVLVLGWMGIIFMQLGWFANLPLLVGIILLLCRRWVGTIICTIIAILLALDTFVIFSQEIPANEAGTSTTKVGHLYISVYFWFFSMILLGIGAVVLRSRERSLRQQAYQPYPPYPQR